MNRSICNVLTIATLTAFAASHALAGPINPPAGAISSTNKPLAEIEPRIAINSTNTPGDSDSVFKITQPGSYYLTGNVQGAAIKTGIEIGASDVTIDLNGFTLQGVVNSFDGIGVSGGGISDITIVNGLIRGWGEDGIDLYQGVVQTARIENVTCIGNSGRGIRVHGRAIVANCTANLNGNIGFDVNSACTFTNCTANQNVGNGFDVGALCTIVGCQANQNLIGMSCGTSTSITNCCVTNNASDGIHCTLGAIISGCTASSNAVNGIFVGNQSLVTNNLCMSDGQGAALGTGIIVANDCRVEGNTCSTSDRGIQATGTNNVIVRNTCSGNVINWVIAANNVCGPILDRTSPASAAISGNSAASSLGSTEANANFTH